MTDQGVRFSRSIIRPPADSFAEGLTASDLGAPNLERARVQHAQYCLALQRLGVTLLPVPPDSMYPDSTFVEDTAVVTAHGAMLARPGAPSRQGEVTTIREVLESQYATVAEIIAPGTLDGGDICQVDGHFFIGLSHRTNEEGGRQLTSWLGRFGYTTSTISIRESRELLHLKSGIAWLGDRRLVVAEALVGHPALRGYEQLVAATEETYAANCVRVNDAVLMAAGFPELTARVSAFGREVVVLDVSEFRKMDGGLSCLSIRLP
ncbi:MAG: arginine deiminase family protein [Gemmatimonadales bacterium]